MTNRKIAGVIFVLTLIVLSWAGRTQGDVRDEGYYFDAAEQYYGWYGELGDNLLAGHPLRSFSRSSVDRWFGYNHEHPALMKTLFGFSWRIFHKCRCNKQGGKHPLNYTKPHRTLSLLDEESAMRLPTDALVAMMAAILFLWGAAAWCPLAGLVAAALGVLAPRLFFDAQLATFDAPIAALWVAVVYGYWRALQAPQKWGWRTGVIFGLALATKHNAFFIPVVLGPHFLFIAWRQRRLPPLNAFLWMALVGPLVYLACWPWLWFSTASRFREYVAFHVHHVYYNMEYLGLNYNKPPFPISFPYVMTALTLPVTTLILALGGAFVLARKFLRTGDGETPQKERLGTGLLIGLNALFPMAIITITRAPIFGATKHWHATIPFLALLAGYAIFALHQSLGASRKWAIALALAACLPAAAETWRAHPYGLSHYNLLAGGPPGGADLGMNRQFWGYSTRGILPWINLHALPHSPIYWHDTNQSQLNMEARIGLLRDDTWNTGLEEPGVKASNIAMVIHEKHFNKYEYWIWDFYGTARPSLVLDDEGVPIVTVYERPRK